MFENALSTECFGTMLIKHGEVQMEIFPSLLNLKLNPADALSYSGGPRAKHMSTYPSEFL